MSFGCHPAHDTKFFKIPIPSTSTSTKAPFFSDPIPEGVPVAIKSPGRSVISLESKTDQLRDFETEFETPNSNANIKELAREFQIQSIKLNISKISLEISSKRCYMIHHYSSKLFIKVP